MVLRMWPALDTPGWLDTSTTLHLWTQIVGKTRLALASPTHHWWHVSLYVSVTGLATGPMPHGDRSFEIELDLVNHELRLRDDRGEARGFALEAMSVATFYRRYLETLRDAGLFVRIRPVPVEVEVAIPFAEDEHHASYDPGWATRFATALRLVDGELKTFRGGFLGKASPVHFFWGGFDLAVTRFSGRVAPQHPGGIPNCPDRVMWEAYSHEVSSAGFWTGSERDPEAAFYAYAYPTPDGFDRATVRPAAARWDTALGEFILPYDAVRRADDPRGDLRAFLDSTYHAAADTARWDRRSLERQE
jgi:hypothetical protein